MAHIECEVSYFPARKYLRDYPSFSRKLERAANLTGYQRPSHRTLFERAITAYRAQLHDICENWWKQKKDNLLEGAKSSKKE